MGVRGQIITLSGVQKGQFVRCGQNLKTKNELIIFNRV